jgi:hypothetical protein
VHYADITFNEQTAPCCRGYADDHIQFLDDEKATAEAATNKLFKSALFNLPYAGRWRARVLLDSEKLPAEPAVEFEVSLASPLPPWIVLAPWIGWPIGVMALFCIHQWLVSRKQRRPHSPPTLPLNKQLQIELGHVS